MAAPTESTVLTCSVKGQAELKKVFEHFGPHFEENFGVVKGGRRRHSRRRSHRRGGGVFGDIAGALCGLAAAPFKRFAEDFSTFISSIHPTLQDVLDNPGKRADFIKAVNRILVAAAGTLAVRDLATPDSKITAVTLALLEGIQSFIPKTLTLSEISTLTTNLAKISEGTVMTGGAFFLGAASVWGMHMVYTRVLKPGAEATAAVASEAVTPEGFGRLVDSLFSRPDVSRTINRAIQVVLKTSPDRLRIEDMPVLAPPVVTGRLWPERRERSTSLHEAPPLSPGGTGGRRTRKHRRHHARKHTFRRKH